MADPNLDMLGNILRDQLHAQPIFKRYANTVTSAVGLLVAVVWTLISVGIDMPAGVTTGVLVLVSVFTTVGVKLTPNGVTERQVEEITDYVDQRRES